MCGSVESFDGLCGIIHLTSHNQMQVRCKYEFGHSGEHSLVKSSSKEGPFRFFVHDTILTRSIK